MIELTDHPTIYKPTPEEILAYEEEHGREATVSLLMEREELIKSEKMIHLTIGKCCLIGKMQKNY